MILFLYVQYYFTLKNLKSIFKSIFNLISGTNISNSLYRSDGILNYTQCATFSLSAVPRIITSFNRRCSLNYWNPRGSVLSRAERAARSVNFQGSSFIIYVIITWKHRNGRRRHMSQTARPHSPFLSVHYSFAERCNKVYPPRARGRIAGSRS